MKFTTTKYVSIHVFLVGGIKCGNTIEVLLFQSKEGALDCILILYLT